MFDLPTTDQVRDKTTAIRIITSKVNRILAENPPHPPISSKPEKEGASLALTQIDRAPPIARVICSRDLAGFCAGSATISPPAGEYRIFADTIARAADGEVSAEHSQWAFWRGLVLRCDLPELSPLRERIYLAARLDSR